MGKELGELGGFGLVFHSPLSQPKGKCLSTAAFQTILLHC